jgi:hypothetical protein
VTSLYATRAIPRLRCNTINTLTLSCSFLRRVCAVLQDTTVDTYITVCYHQRARRGAVDSAGGAAGRAGCCATHITMHFLLSSINQRRADCAAGGGARTVVCYVYHVYYHQQYRTQLSAGSARETQEAGEVLLCNSVLRSYVKSRIGGEGAVLRCTIINNYRSMRRTRRVFQLLQGLRYFK